MKYHLNKDIVDLSYRYMWDDWGISSHTFNMRYRWMLGNKHYLFPDLDAMIFQFSYSF